MAPKSVKIAEDYNDKDLYDDSDMKSEEGKHFLKNLLILMLEMDIIPPLKQSQDLMINKLRSGMAK